MWIREPLHDWWLACYTWAVSRHTDVTQEIGGKQTLVMGGLPGMRSKGHLIAHTQAHFSRSFDCTGTVKYNTMIKMRRPVAIRAPGTAMVVICTQVITRNPRQGGVTMTTSEGARYTLKVDLQQCLGLGKVHKTVNLFTIFLIFILLAFFTLTFLLFFSLFIQFFFSLSV